MNKHQTLLTAIMASLFTLMAVTGSVLIIGRALAAPPEGTAARPTSQGLANNSRYTSVSALAFMPVSESAQYNKDIRRQLLSLATQDRTFPVDSNIFVAPLALPDQAILTGLAMFGEDFDNQGAVQLRLKRCDHGQARCVNIVETTSTDSYAAGQFETVRVTNLNEIVDNSLYSFFLELELTALLNSGLRSVRLEMAGENSGNLPPPGNVEQWSLSGDIRSFLIPNTDLAQVRICTNDLSDLPNPTHYPTLVVDGKSMTLGSNTCVTVWGRDIELHRELNAGPSSGTYQILR